MSWGSNRFRCQSAPKSCSSYLDQNFLSEMSKADTNERVRPEFKDVYELLHAGFVDEKLVIPPPACMTLNPASRRISRPQARGCRNS